MISQSSLDIGPEEVVTGKDLDKFFTEIEAEGHG